MALMHNFVIFEENEFERNLSSSYGHLVVLRVKYFTGQQSLSIWLSSYAPKTRISKYKVCRKCNEAFIIVTGVVILSNVACTAPASTGLYIFRNIVYNFRINGGPVWRLSLLQLS